MGRIRCVDGRNSLNGTPNCIFKNFDSPAEKVGSAKTDYSAVLFEVFKYFGGYTSPANARADVAGTPVSPSQFGPLRYAGDPDAKSDPAAYVNGANDPTKREYVPPDGGGGCPQNVIIFIGNGFPSQDAPASLLSGVGGSTSQLMMPTTTGTYVLPTGNEIKYPDEWAKFLYTTDVSSFVGSQGISVYTIDVYNAQPDGRQNRLLMSMAKHGGGQYFAAKSEDAILSALRQILIDVKSVNSVFTSASVPINATNRAQYENQVYIGMFRPDGDSRPRWYGNLKRLQVGTVDGHIRLTDRNNDDAIAASTGFLKACAISYWTTDSGSYWNFSPSSAGLCTTMPSNVFSDLPDGPAVEKGGVGEVLRRSNDPASSNPPFAVSRNMYTCTSATNCSSLVLFNAANVSQSAVGAASAAEQQRIIDHTFGKDVNDDNGNGNATESRATIHGDVVHSRPLPVNYGGDTGVVLFYGANDGSFRAVSGSNGKELWAFVAPEHHARLKRLMDNSPVVQYAGMPSGITPLPKPKDYFFDGTPGLYQSAGNNSVWIFPSMRRGGRMIYAFDVTNPAAPSLKWRVGCPDLGDDTGCTVGFDQLGQTWSTPMIARVKGYNSGTTPILVVGGGYDNCDDSDTANPSCSSTSVKGKGVFVLNAATGERLATFTTNRGVAADVALVDRNGDGFVDHAYVADTGGSLYRLDFSDPISFTPLASTNWVFTNVARTQGSGRKFLFAPAVMPSKSAVYIAIGSGDRERPLYTQYPYIEDVKNRFYMFIDRFQNGGPVDLDGTSLANFSGDTTCNSSFSSNQNGWYMDLNAGRGEQTVTSALIFGGLAYFSTNRPLPNATGMCTPDLGEARGYAVNLLNASGAVGTESICGAARSNIFTGGGLPPSPVTATLPVNGKPVTVLFGGAERGGGVSSSVGAQRVKPALSGKRSRPFWYTGGNN